eukprot:666444-Alexandrium_andersonii.AAC.1
MRQAASQQSSSPKLGAPELQFRLPRAQGAYWGGGSEFRRFRAMERAVWPVGRSGTTVVSGWV